MAGPWRGSSARAGAPLPARPCELRSGSPRHELRSVCVCSRVPRAASLCGALSRSACSGALEPAHTKRAPLRSGCVPERERGLELARVPQRSRCVLSIPRACYCPTMPLASSRVLMPRGLHALSRCSSVHCGAPLESIKTESTSSPLSVCATTVSSLCASRLTLERLPCTTPRSFATVSPLSGGAPLSRGAPPAVCLSIVCEAA